MVGRIAALLVALLFLAGCSGGGGTQTAADGGSESASRAVAAGDEAGADQPEQGEAEMPAEEAPAPAPAEGSGDASGVGPAGDDDADAPLPAAPPPTGDRIIKEGTITLEVEDGQFDRAFIAVIDAARRQGGDVIGSSTRTGDEGETFGSVTVRVPVANFEDLLVGMGDIGITRSRDVDAKDVTAEYTDLESRLRHLRAQEEFYLGLLTRAEDVRDAIAVQQQLDGIQAQIERIQGRLNVLEDRTSFSTLTVELFEPGAAGSLPTEEEPPARPTLARYWDTARDAFVNVLGAMLVAGLFAFPLLVAAGAAFVMWRLLRRPPARSAAAREAPEPVAAAPER